MSQTRFWTVTLNNYEDHDIELWRLCVPSQADYLCFQRETAPTTGTRHLQGYIVFPKKIRLSGVKSVLGSSIHAVRSNGSPSSNRAYCSKPETAIPGSFREFGTLPPDPSRGKRSDFDEFKQAVSEGLTCKHQARQDFSELTAKYPRWCYDILSDKTEISVVEHSLRDWQQDLLDRLTLTANDRDVIFVVDTQGNHGKTWFAKWYTKKFDDPQYLEPCKKADMAYALKDHLRVLFINVTRTSDTSQIDYLYSFIESVKDGMVFSPKYESRMKYLTNVHVVVMTNSEPNMQLLSVDRYVIIELQ